MVEFNPLADGSCQFSAIAYHLNKIEKRPKYTSQQVRTDIIHYFIHNADWREGFSNRHPNKTIDTYIKEMSYPRAWGDEDTLFAAAQLYQIKIRVFSTFTLDVTYKPTNQDTSNIPEVWLGHKVQECHYVALTKSLGRFKNLVLYRVSRTLSPPLREA